MVRTMYSMSLAAPRNQGTGPPKTVTVLRPGATAATSSSTAAAAKRPIRVITLPLSQRLAEKAGMSDSPEKSTSLATADELVNRRCDPQPASASIPCSDRSAIVTDGNANTARVTGPDQSSHDKSAFDDDDEDDSDDEGSGRLMIDEESKSPEKDDTSSAKRPKRQRKLTAKAKSLPTGVDPKSNLIKPIARALLLRPGAAYTIADFVKDCPVFLKTNLSSLESVLSLLVEQGLLRPVDDDLSLSNLEQAFEKERSRAKISALTDYGIDLTAYNNSFQL